MNLLIKYLLSDLTTLGTPLEDGDHMFICCAQVDIPTQK
jgi:hypothetical protein